MAGVDGTFDRLSLPNVPSQFMKDFLRAKCIMQTANDHVHLRVRSGVVWCGGCELQGCRVALQGNPASAKSQANHFFNELYLRPFFFSFSFFFKTLAT